MNFKLIQQLFQNVIENLSDQNDSCDLVCLNFMNFMDTKNLNINTLILLQ